MDKDGDSASGKGSGTGGTSMRKPRQKTARPGAAPLGDALRGVYEKTVEESVPQEMLDLLGKLG